MGASFHILVLVLSFVTLSSCERLCEPWSLVKMASNDDLIDHEKDVLIDDLKEELHYIKKKIKQYKYSEETFENEMDLVECENKNLRKDLLRI